MTGLERVAANRSVLGRTSRAGLLTHPAGVMRDLEPGAATLLRAGVPLVRLLAPEHGIDGSGQAGEAPERALDPATGLEVVTTYGRRPPEIAPLLAGLDLLLIDLQDVGTRFYTYLSSMHDALAAAAEAGVRAVVLDRPNPLGWRAHGPVLRPEFRSFVGTAEIPLAHGLTMGEAARVLAPGGLELSVVPCDPREPYGPGALPWVPPSPNMPDLETARLYPGMGLVEGSDLSEGRGTALPFRWVGAPGLDARALAGRLNALGLDGVRFRPVHFTPTISKHAGALCSGVQVHVVGTVERPVLVGLSVLAAAIELGATPNPAWLRKLLGVPIDAEDLRLDGVAELVDAWDLEAQSWSEANSAARLYERA